MKVILLLCFIFVGAQCTTYDTEIYDIEAKNETILLVDSSSGYQANDGSKIYGVSVLTPLFVDQFEIEYEFEDRMGNVLCKGKITTCDCNPATPSGAAMAILLKNIASKDAECPLMDDDYKVPERSRIENVELGPDAMDVDTIILYLNMQEVLYMETYLYKVK